MAETLRAGLIGAHIGRSRFSAALDLLCTAHGMDLDFGVIDSARHPNFDFSSTVEQCRAAGWAGVSVTHPFKSQAYELAQAAGQSDQDALNAANLLVFGPPLRRANTDFSGFMSAWRWRFGDANPGCVCMAGAGGVASALGVALAELGARDIAIWDTQPARAENLAHQIGAPARHVQGDDIDQALLKATGLVNATPLGMAEYPGSAFDHPFASQPEWVFDAVYTPTLTSFMSFAAASGVELLSGFDLFRHMVLDSFAVYTGITPDSSLFLERLEPLRPT